VILGNLAAIFLIFEVNRDFSRSNAKPLPDLKLLFIVTNKKGKKL